MKNNQYKQYKVAARMQMWNQGFRLKLPIIIDGKEHKFIARINGKYYVAWYIAIADCMAVGSLLVSYGVKGDPVSYRYFSHADRLGVDGHLIEMEGLQSTCDEGDCF